MGAGPPTAGARTMGPCNWTSRGGGASGGLVRGTCTLGLLARRCLGFEFFEHLDGGLDELLTGAFGAAGADDLVVALGVGGAVGDVADDAVGELGDVGLGEGGGGLDAQAQLDEDLA